MRTAHTPEQEHAAVGTLMGFTEDDAAAADTVPTSGLLVQQLLLQRVGSHHDTRVELTQPITFIVGPNGAGKSTLAEAILYGVTGRGARGQDGRGAGAQALVQTGHDRLRVTVRLRDVGDVQREVRDGKARLVLDPPASTEDVQGDLYARLRTNEGRLRAVFHGATLLDADHAAGKELLLDVLQVRVTVDGQALTLPQLEARYKAAYDERAAAKRDRDRLRVPPRPDRPAPDVADIEARLAALRERERALMGATSEAAGARGPIEQQMSALRSEHLSLGRALIEEPRRREALQALVSALGDEQPEAPRPETDAAAVRASVVEADGRLRLVTSLMASVDGHAPERGCVLHAEVPCKTSATAFSAALAHLRAEAAARGQELAHARAQVDALQAQAARDQRTADLHRRKAQAEEEIEGYAVIRARRADLDAQMTRVQASIDALGAVQDDPELGTVRERLRKGEQVLAEARVLQRAWSAYQAAADDMDRLNAEVTRLEALVGQIGPKGARVPALAAAVDGFVGRINGHLARVGITLGIEVDPWLVRVNGRPASRLSTSERLRAGVGLQLAFAEVTGLDLVVIDNSEWLVTPEVRGAFHRLVIGWAKAAPSRQAIVIAAKEDGWRLPVIPGTAVLRVRQDTPGVSTVIVDVEG